jgi:predicted amidophosphoribosyltransferase
MVRLGVYAGPLRRWVHEIKFTRWRRLGEDLGEMLGAALRTAYAEHGPGERPPLLVAVPDDPFRRIWRGIDHAAVITQRVARVTGWPVIRPLYRRPGRSQLSVPPSERAANAARAYGLRKGRWREDLASKTVVLVDDVVTTGATMRACAKAITGAWSRGEREGRPRVWAACLGRAEIRAGPGDGRMW